LFCGLSSFTFFRYTTLFRSVGLIHLFQIPYGEQRFTIWQGEPDRDLSIRWVSHTALVDYRVVFCRLRRHSKISFKSCVSVVASRDRKSTRLNSSHVSISYAV